MTDTPEIAEWLTRFEKKFGANETASALQKLSDARELFYSELNYNLTRKQFEALRSEVDARDIDYKSVNVRLEPGRLYRDKQHRDIVHQLNYRDIQTGRFMKKSDVAELIMDNPTINKGINTTRRTNFRVRRVRVDSKGNPL